MSWIVAIERRPERPGQAAWGAESLGGGAASARRPLGTRAEVLEALENVAPDAVLSGRSCARLRRPGFRAAIGLGARDTVERVVLRMRGTDDEACLELLEALCARLEGARALDCSTGLPVCFGSEDAAMGFREWHLSVEQSSRLREEAAAAGRPRKTPRAIMIQAAARRRAPVRLFLFFLAVQLMLWAAVWPEYENVSRLRALLTSGKSASGRIASVAAHEGKALYTYTFVTAGGGGFAGSLIQGGERPRARIGRYPLEYLAGQGMAGAPSAVGDEIEIAYLASDPAVNAPSAIVGLVVQDTRKALLRNAGLALALSAGLGAFLWAWRRQAGVS